MYEQPDLFVSSPSPHVYSVRELNEVVRQLLEAGFGDVVVEGEISNAKLQSSGHWYFTLKDEAAQLAAVLFRSDAVGLRFRVENGLHVRATGRLNLYVPQGKYQIQVRRLVPVGQGALELAFRQLCDKLRVEGLFETARKRGLPRFPRRVALVTSPTGAAVRDMLTTLSQRWPLARVLVVPVAVQGESAPGEIVRALQLLDRMADCDVVLLGRGGGSLEDLWAFNDEAVARAIAACRIPVVTGIGHEVDTTIADLVADRRAATPTAAAALAVPHRDEIRTLLRQLDLRMARGLRRRLEVPRARLEALRQGFGMRRLRFLVPEHLQTLDVLHERLERSTKSCQREHARRLTSALAHLQALSPRGILERGYVFCVDPVTGRIIGRAVETSAGQELDLHFADGRRTARVLPSDGAGAPSPASVRKGKA